MLVRTSTRPSSELQMLDLADGTKVYEHVADLSGRMGRRDHRQPRLLPRGRGGQATTPEEGKGVA